MTSKTSAYSNAIGRSGTRRTKTSVIAPLQSGIGPIARTTPESLMPDAEIVLDLPFPPSTNHIWRHSRGHVYRTKNYVQWQKDAYYLAKAEGRWPTAKITGPFEFYLYLAEKNENGLNHRGDGDNRIKPVLDFLQMFKVIRNDSDCRKGGWEWVPRSGAPTGCRLVLFGL